MKYRIIINPLTIMTTSGLILAGVSLFYNPLRLMDDYSADKRTVQATQPATQPSGLEKRVIG